MHYFAKEWVKAGHNVLVIHNYVKFPSMYSKLPFVNDVKWNYKEDYKGVTYSKQDGVDVYLLPVNRYIPRYNYLFPVDVIKQKKIIINIMEKHKFQPDLFLCHFSVSQWRIVKSLKKEITCKKVAILHNSDINYLNRQKNKKILNEITSYYDKFGFRSEKIYNDFNKLTESKNERFLVHSGAPDKILSNSSKYQDRVFNPQKIRLIYAGNLIPLKNVDVTLKALALIKDQYDFQFEIIGTGPMESELKGLVSQLELEDKVEFCGYKSREQVIEKMSKSDYFVMVSSPETFGITYIEAMACRCIVVGSKGEGIDGVMQDKINGFLVKPRDIEELAKTLSYIFDIKSDEREKILTNSYKTAKEYTETNVAKRYIDQAIID